MKSHASFFFPLVQPPVSRHPVSVSPDTLSVTDSTQGDDHKQQEDFSDDYSSVESKPTTKQTHSTVKDASLSACLSFTHSPRHKSACNHEEEQQQENCSTTLASLVLPPPPILAKATTSTFWVPEVQESVASTNANYPCRNTTAAAAPTTTSHPVPLTSCNDDHDGFLASMIPTVEVDPVDKMIMELHEQQPKDDPLLSLGFLDRHTSADPSDLYKVLESDFALGRRLDQILSDAVSQW